MSQLNSSLYSQKLNNGYFKIMKLKIQLGDTGDRTRGLSHAKRTRYHCAISPSVCDYYLASVYLSLLYVCSRFLNNIHSAWSSRVERDEDPIGKLMPIQ